MTARPIKVIELIARLNVGGPAVLVIDLAAELGRQGFEVAVAAGEVGPGEAEMGFVAQRRGVTWQRIDGLSPRLGRGNLTALRELVGLIRRERPDILHTHTAKAGSLGRAAALLAGRRGMKLVHSFHGHVFRGYFPAWQTRLFIFIERFLARFTDRIIALGPEQARDLSAVYRICRPDKLAVIANGLDLTPFRQAQPGGGFRAGLNLPDGAWLVGQVGRLTKIKAPADSLAALKQTDERVHLALVGSGELEPELRQQAAETGLVDRVHFVGWQEDMPSVYADLDALVLPSLNEGQPLAVIEAMAAGLPVAATLVGGLPGLLGVDQPPQRGEIAVGPRGVAVNPGDPAGLAQALNRLHGDRAEAGALAARAADYVAQNYSTETFIQAHAELYSKLAGAGSK